MVVFEVSYMTQSNETSFKTFSIISSNRQILGEGLSHHDDHQQACWVDIIGDLVTRKNLLTGQEDYFSKFRLPSRTFIDKRRRLFVAHQGGISLVKSDFSSSIDCVDWFEKDSEIRCNDGAMDRDGNIWISTMSILHEPNRASIWFWNRKSKPKLIIDDLTIPNSIVLDSERRRLYFADSQNNTIYYGILSDRDSRISKIKEFHKSKVGTPDGSIMDGKGNLWNARWGGSCILKISPQGNEELKIMTPFKLPTSCVLVEQESSLIVTSAQHEGDSLGGYTIKMRL